MLPQYFYYSSHGCVTLFYGLLCNITRNVIKKILKSRNLGQSPTCGRKFDWGDNLGGYNFAPKTTPGECNCISLHSMHSVHFWRVNISRVNTVVSGSKFTKFFPSNARWIVVDNAIFILSIALSTLQICAIKI